MDTKRMETNKEEEKKTKSNAIESSCRTSVGCCNRNETIELKLPRITGKLCDECNTFCLGHLRRLKMRHRFVTIDGPYLDWQCVLKTKILSFFAINAQAHDVLLGRATTIFSTLRCSNNGCTECAAKHAVAAQNDNKKHENICRCDATKESACKSTLATKIRDRLIDLFHLTYV